VPDGPRWMTIKLLVWYYFHMNKVVTDDQLAAARYSA
jgi:hypothetical protein